MTRYGAPARFLTSLAAILLVSAVLAMHALGMPMGSQVPRGSHSTAMGHAIPHQATMSESMSACATHHCAAVRGAEPVATHAAPNTTVALPIATSRTAEPAGLVSDRASRAPPRSGSSSLLCVWRQ